MNNLQRYRENNCASIPDDKGPYYLATDVNEKEKIRAQVIDTHLFISPEEFMALATFKMTNDDPDQDADMDIVESVLEQIAVKCLGFDNWIQAYHEIEG